MIGICLKLTKKKKKHHISEVGVVIPWPWVATWFRLPPPYGTIFPPNAFQGCPNKLMLNILEFPSTKYFTYFHIIFPENLCDAVTIGIVSKQKKKGIVSL